MPTRAISGYWSMGPGFAEIYCAGGPMPILVYVSEQLTEPTRAYAHRNLSNLPLSPTKHSPILSLLLAVGKSIEAAISRSCGFVRCPIGKRV